ncbi:MAG TPA: hypothetical protein VIL97_10350 [Thermoanaerobaculia bacterium]
MNEAILDEPIELELEQLDELHSLGARENGDIFLARRAECRRLLPRSIGE